MSSRRVPCKHGSLSCPYCGRIIVIDYPARGSEEPDR